MREQKGNMYEFVTHTWNAISGKCSFDCQYCYMKVWGEQKPIRLDKKQLKTDLGKDNYIFVGSSTDMFAPDIPHKWIKQVLEHCKKFENTYLFQSKNPKMFGTYMNDFPEKTILCTTIETNRDISNISKAPSVKDRAGVMEIISKLGYFDTAITIEPILDFDVEEFADMIKKIKPKFVTIGADSKKHGLKEPTKEKVDALIKALSKFDIKVKDNLGRLLK